MRRVRTGSFLAAFLFAAAAPLFAQQGTAEIGGRVTDEQGGVLPGAIIVLTNDATGLFREVTSGCSWIFTTSQTARTSIIPRATVGSRRRSSC